MAEVRKRYGRRKVCRFCEDKIAWIDYKDVKTLKGYTSERGKIIPRRISGELRAPSARGDHGDQEGPEYCDHPVRGGAVASPFGVRVRGSELKDPEPWGAVSPLSSLRTPDPERRPEQMDKPRIRG